MILIAGSIQRSFLFPANRSSAFNFYGDIERTLNFLPHISIQEHLGENRYRLRYGSTELGVYEVQIMCDLKVIHEKSNWCLSFQPVDDLSPAEDQASLYSTCGQGYFTSQSLFIEEGSQTRIRYQLSLHAKLPVPLGLRFMPKRLINAIARNITQGRIDDIADRFIMNSVDSYQPSIGMD